jgi:hypothetical protein
MQYTSMFPVSFKKFVTIYHSRGEQVKSLLDSLQLL